MSKIQKNSKFFNIVFILSLIISTFGVGYYFGTGNPAISKFIYKTPISLAIDPISDISEEVLKGLGDLDDPVDFELYWDVWEAVKSYHVDQGEVSDRELFYGSLKGIVDSLDDPYSTFFNPEKAKRFDDDLSGSFEGIGTQIGIKDDRLTIIAPLPETPAENAGIKSGDKILFIDDYDTTDISIDEAVNRIRGPKGQAVVLTIFREGESELMKISIIRDKIALKSVNWKKLDGFGNKSYYYINLVSFNEEAYTKMAEAINEILGNNPDGLILDLRNNPGGFLELSVQVSSLWVENGVIVTEKYSGDKIKSHKSTGKAVLKDLPTIVLIDQGSASASEIVAGALQDHKKAIIIGFTSFGKGSVQSLIKFDDTSAAKITVAEWLTPDGRQIHGKGIEPDLIVPFTFEDYENGRDPQLEQAKAFLGKSYDDVLLEIQKLQDESDIAKEALKSTE